MRIFSKWLTHGIPLWSLVTNTPNSQYSFLRKTNLNICQNLNNVTIFDNEIFISHTTYLHRQSTWNIFTFLERMSIFVNMENSRSSCQSTTGSGRVEEKIVFVDEGEWYRSAPFKDLIAMRCTLISRHRYDPD